MKRPSEERDATASLGCLWAIYRATYFQRIALRNKPELARQRCWVHPRLTWMGREETRAGGFHSSPQWKVSRVRQRPRWKRTNVTTLRLEDEHPTERVTYLFSPGQGESKVSLRKGQGGGLADKP